MRIKLALRVVIVIACAVLLLIVTRPRIQHPLHPYKAADFELQDLHGNPVQLSAFRGKAIVLDFWATWCGPCRREIPWLIDFQKEYGPQGLQVIGISMDEDSTDAIARFVGRTGINYTVLLGDDRVSSQYGGVSILPTTYFISRNGNVLAYAKGLSTKTALERSIKEALVSTR